MNQDYKDFLRSALSKDGPALFTGGVSDYRLNQIIETIWNGGKI